MGIVVLSTYHAVCRPQCVSEPGSFKISVQIRFLPNYRLPTCHETFYSNYSPDMCRTNRGQYNWYPFHCGLTDLRSCCHVLPNTNHPRDDNLFIRKRAAQINTFTFFTHLSTYPPQIKIYNFNCTKIYIYIFLQNTENLKKNLKSEATWIHLFNLNHSLLLR